MPPIHTQPAAAEVAAPISRRPATPSVDPGSSSPCNDPGLRSVRASWRMTTPRGRSSYDRVGPLARKLATLALVVAVPTQAPSAGQSSSTARHMSSAGSAAQPWRAWFGHKMRSCARLSALLVPLRRPGERRVSVLERRNFMSLAMSRSSAKVGRARLGILAFAVLAFLAVLGVSGVASAGSVNPPSWSVAKSPNGGDLIASELTGVSCVSPTNCTAVGNGAGFIGGTPAWLIEAWNGSAWSVVKEGPIGNKSPLDYTTFSGVSCPSATYCAAVGSNNGGKRWQTVIEQWNGSTWSVIDTPKIPGKSVGGGLNAVSCMSAQDCTAVGELLDHGTASQGLVERWNGSGWKIVNSPPAPGGYLRGVSCVTASDCTAVGWDGGFTVSTVSPLIERWDGKNWTIMKSPLPSGHGALNGVSCVAARTCTAVGSDRNGDGPLIERWNGKNWTIAKSRALSGHGSLNGVECLSARSCTAVGGPVDTSSGQIIVRWNGSQWLRATAPRGNHDAILNAVSCATTVSCTAVGFNGNPIIEQSHA